MQLGSLIRGLDVSLADPTHSDMRICDVTEDSRTALPGSLFIARPGEQADGRRYIEDAVRAGSTAILTDPACPRPPDQRDLAWLTVADVPAAGAAIAERFFDNPSSKLTVIGVTGTNGKTTTAHLIHHLLNKCGIRCGLIGTVTIDDGFEIAEATLTTPPATELSQALASMVEAGCRAVVLEASSHAIEQKRVAALDFDLGIFTNLSGDHLDYHKSMDAYFEVKSRLFTGLKPGGLAILNADDGRAGQLRRACSCHVLTCSAQGELAADARISATSMSLEGMHLRVELPGGTIEGDCPIIGRHNLMNVIEAIAAAVEAGAPLSLVPHALLTAGLPPGRLERVEPPAGIDQHFHVFVDYAHTDDALRSSLRSIRELMGPVSCRLIVVFGCGGDRDKSKRPRMAEVASHLADHVIITSDNPRTESPAHIIRDILSGVRDDSYTTVSVESDRSRAIQRAIDEANNGDVVLIAGKGHERYQLLPNGFGGIRRIDFDDRQVAREAMSERLRRVSRSSDGPPVTVMDKVSRQRSGLG